MLEELTNLKYSQVQPFYATDVISDTVQLYIPMHRNLWLVLRMISAAATLFQNIVGTILLFPQCVTYFAYIAPYHMQIRLLFLNSCQREEMFSPEYTLEEHSG